MKRAAQFLVVGIAGAGIIAAATISSHSSGARAADTARPGTAKVTVPAASADSRTCAAFRAWDAHHSTANLDKIITASLAAPWHWIGNDAGALYMDVRNGEKPKYIEEDASYFRGDCSKLKH